MPDEGAVAAVFKTMKLTIVRHGETMENATGIIMGQANPDLNPTGILQAKALAARFRDYKLDFIYCSDLKRAKDTLEEIIKFHKSTPVIYDTRLRERNLGELQGTKRSDLNWNDFEGSEMDKKPKGAESLTEMRARVQQFIDEIKKLHSDHNLLIVTHSGVIRIINSILTGTTQVNTLDFANVGIWEYTIEGYKVKVQLINDVDFLK